MQLWHAPGAHDGLNPHEHGDQPQAWVNEFSIENFGHPLVFGGDERSSDIENVHKHQAFKGALMPLNTSSACPVDVYFRYHAASNPMDRASAFHSYEIYFRDCQGGVTFRQGVYWVGYPEFRSQRMSRYNETAGTLLPDGSVAPGRDQFILSAPDNRDWFGLNGLIQTTFTETGYPVCFAFLEFLDRYGGVTQFGYPISGFEYHENKLVQYFEKARMEWQPWRAEGQRVVLSDLGRMYFEKLDEDPALLSPVNPADNRPANVVTLQVRAFAWKAVTLASDSQLIFVIVQDQNLQPVANSSCTTLVHWPNGRAEPTTLMTNTNGVGMVPLYFSSQPYGSLIYVDVVCGYNGFNANTTTSFRIWY